MNLHSTDEVFTSPVNLENIEFDHIRWPISAMISKLPSIIRDPASSISGQFFMFKITTHLLYLCTSLAFCKHHEKNNNLKNFKLNEIDILY